MLKITGGRWNHEKKAAIRQYKLKCGHLDSDTRPHSKKQNNKVPSVSIVQLVEVNVPDGDKVQVVQMLKCNETFILLISSLFFLEDMNFNSKNPDFVKNVQPMTLRLFRMVEAILTDSLVFMACLHDEIRAFAFMFNVGKGNESGSMVIETLDSSSFVRTLSDSKIHDTLRSAVLDSQTSNFEAWWEAAQAFSKKIQSRRPLSEEVEDATCEGRQSRCRLRQGRSSANVGATRRMLTSFVVPRFDSWMDTLLNSDDWSVGYEQAVAYYTEKCKALYADRNGRTNGRNLVTVGSKVQVETIQVVDGEGNEAQFMRTLQCDDTSILLISSLFFVEDVDFAAMKNSTSVDMPTMRRNIFVLMEDMLFGKGIFMACFHDEIRALAFMYETSQNASHSSSVVRTLDSSSFHRIMGYNTSYKKLKKYVLASQMSKFEAWWVAVTAYIASAQHMQRERERQRQRREDRQRRSQRRAQFPSPAFLRRFDSTATHSPLSEVLASDDSTTV